MTVTASPFLDMTCTHKPSTLELDAGRLGVLGQPQLHSEFEESLGYTRHCHKNKNQIPLFLSLSAPPFLMIPESWGGG